MDTGNNHFIRATLVILLVILVSAQFTSPALMDDSREASLLETGRATKIQTPAPVPASIKIISYNIRWRGGEDLRKLIELFKTDREIGRADIIGLQEVDRNKKRTGNKNTARQMAEELGMYYAWTAPPPPPAKDDKKPQEEETGVAIMSVYPLTDVQRIVLPNEGPGGRRRVALGATIKIGETSVRVYSVHAEIRISNEHRLEQFKAVIDDAHTHHAKIERVIVLGDFNTIMGKDVGGTSELFTTAKFNTPFTNNLTTWKTFILELKLDWLWLRGLQATSFGIDKKVGLSDHWPLWAVVTMK
ncbi:MAG TPA: endonuclease/exonuclease/phosphatase family protein [Pyrinomonadaceae bacterium]|jgi:endonuclease/exonuclease/phosphatase family metal-dependent hydrolase|nr:endonuclease/exonuclease/phosphatase family protein [Pyrinomonadaceae bacterium]